MKKSLTLTLTDEELLELERTMLDDDCEGALRLLKNVSPPRCPNATKIRNTAKNKKNAIISPVDHLPIMVLGLRLILMMFIY